MFRLGDTITFDETSFNPEFWANLTEEEKKRYYGRYGYGNATLMLFVFICESPQNGHSILVDTDTGEVLTMVHARNFRLATEEEC